MNPEAAAWLIDLGRFFLGAHYFVAGVRNFGNFSMQAQRMTARGVPQPVAALAIGLAVQTVGGAMVALVIFPAIGAAALILFTIGATVLFHNFWDYTGEERMTHMSFNLTNLALTGGLLLVIATA